MKHTNICPNCNSKKIFIDDADKNHNFLECYDTLNYNDVDRYICVDCGHIEEWAKTFEYEEPITLEDMLKSLYKFFKKKFNYK